MLPRTMRQKEILDYLTLFQERRGYIPSYAQIARHLGVKSRATVAKHIAALERRGLLKREGGNRAEPFQKPFQIKLRAGLLVCPNCNHAFTHNYQEH